MTKKKKRILRKKIFHKLIEHLSICLLEFSSFMCILGYSSVLLLNSFWNSSSYFSLVLAIFSIIITFFFEFVEWAKVRQHNDSGKHSFLTKFILTHFSNVFICIVLVFIGVVFFFTLIFCLLPISFQNGIIAISANVANVLTALSLNIYFISYFVRNHRPFIRKFTLLIRRFMNP